MNGSVMDTNVVSELRKGQKTDTAVLQWLEDEPDEQLFLSVATFGEIRTGIERWRNQDALQASSLEKWLNTLAIRPNSMQIRRELATIRVRQAGKVSRIERWPEHVQRHLQMVSGHVEPDFF